MSVTVLWFASLREQAGVERETLAEVPAGLPDLWRVLAARHGFAIAPERIRVALDGRFVGWDAALRPGAEVAFLPPVSGG